MSCTPEAALKTGAPSREWACKLLTCCWASRLGQPAPAGPLQLTPACLCQAGGVGQPRDRASQHTESAHCKRISWTVQGRG